jgi:hypothetical protein
MHLDKYNIYWPTLVNIEMKLQVSYKVGNLLTN